jgi:DNA repair exonuclease SbcCD ATPase subunit
LNQLDQTQSKLQYWKEIMKVKPQFQLKQTLKIQIGELQSTVNQYHFERQKLNDEHEKYQLHREKSLKIANVISQIKTKKNIIEYINQLMSDYRIWLYKTIVIPQLIEHVNNLVENITDNKTFSLQAILDKPEQHGKSKTKKPVKNTDLKISWFIGNQHNDNIIIEKSGGFRKFIFSLAMRITLSKLGGSSVLCKQLFLDEGFVSADANNLDKIPEFIKSLLNIYDGVLLVSHLDIIKDCANISVNIKKTQKSLSQIQFGNEIVKANSTTVQTPRISIPISNQHALMPKIKLKLK